MSKADTRFFAILAVVSLLITGAVSVHFSTEPRTRSFTDTQLRVFVTEQAECHAEFFYTHDPSITGVGIDQAVSACLPR